MSKILAIAILLSTALISCQKLAEQVDTGNPELFGCWINPQYTDTLVTYTRADDLVVNQYGITFEPNNKLIQRQNSGWCGTPPIITADYEGIWHLNDSIVNFTVGYWGGTADFSWKIITLNIRKLAVSVIKSDYHQVK
jgi:hypothetical protein